MNLKIRKFKIVIVIDLIGFVSFWFENGRCVLLEYM